MIECSPKTRIKLDNVLCAYCHQPFVSRTDREEEHVIGRKFVPRGTLAAQWNLIVNACGKCNDEKSELENDISAILMQSDRLERFAVDERLRAEASRKGTSRSKRTGKTVAESDESLTIQGAFGPGITFSAGMSCGPQVDPERVHRLAFYHVAAFYYLMTYKEDERRGSPIPWTFCPLAAVARGDWGNCEMVGFEKLTADWPGRFYGVGADTFFKAIIRRSPADQTPLWSYALEWNHSMRIVGFFGNGDAAQATADQIPEPEMRIFESGVDPEKGRFITRGRVEVPLEPAADHLFDCPANITMSGE